MTQTLSDIQTDSSTLKTYVCRPGIPKIVAGQQPADAEIWRDAAWNAADIARIEQYHPLSSSHRPKVAARLLHDDARALYLRFDVDDRFVLARAEVDHDPVYFDACVELFIQPRDKGGYLNFEFNCSGVSLVSFVRDPRRAGNTLADCDPLGAELLSQLTIMRTMPKRVDPEITEPIAWSLAVTIPFAVMEAFVGPIEPLSGTRWRANFNKCADRCSHPHWGTWSPHGKNREFHQPLLFGHVVFE